MSSLEIEAIRQLANQIYQKGITAGQGDVAAPDPLSGLPEPLPLQAVTPHPPGLEPCPPQQVFPAQPVRSFEPLPDAAPSYYFISRSSGRTDRPLPGGALMDGENPVPFTDAALHPEVRQNGATVAGSDHSFQAARDDFPILRQQVNGKPLIWFDNAATTQKPRAVLETLHRFYQESNSNVHRGAHTLAGKATQAYESARDKLQKMIGAARSEEIIFVRGTTEAINLVAQTYGLQHLGKGDEVLVSTMEHHSNIVPWQLICERAGAVLHSIPITTQGEVVLGEYEKLLSRRARIVAITHVSNVLGTVNPIRTMIEMAHRYGARVVVDGAQSVPHFPVDVRELDADFYAFSGHKMYGPTGIGVLYGKKALLEEMPPWQGGGNMIKTVTFEGTTFDSLPAKFEAGTGNIADAVGLGAAADYLGRIGMDRIAEHEGRLTAYAMDRLGRIPGLRLIGTAPHKTSVISFLHQGMAYEDLARYLDQEGIAVRSGHHCAQPLMQHFRLPGTVRASLGLYNTKAEIDTLTEAILKISKTHS